MKLVFQTLVEDFLPVCHLAENVDLLFWSEFAFNIAFNSSKHEGFKDFMKSLNVLLVYHFVTT